MGRPEAGAYVAVLVALAAAPCGAGDRGEVAPKLGLVWVDPVRLAPGSFGVLKAESTGLLASLGADVSWSEALDGEVLGPESMAVIAVPTHHFDGERPHVMGATRPDTSLPAAVWVYPDEIAWALGFDVRARSSWSVALRAMFGLALARVVSHEVVHALGVPAHARYGLMAATLDRRALTNATIHIDPKTLAAVKVARPATLVAGGSTPPIRMAAPAVIPDGVLASRGPGH